MSHKSNFLKVAHVSLVNQRLFNFPILSNLVFFIVLCPFPIKYAVTFSKCYVTHMGGVKLFVMNYYMWVGRVERIFSVT